MIEPDETALLDAAAEGQRTDNRPLQKRQAALVFVFIAIALDMIAFGITTPVLSPLIVSFSGGAIAQATLWATLFGTAWALMQFFFSPLLGMLSDRFGRRTVMLISIFGLGFDYVVMALAPNLGWLFLGRVVSGICAATMVTAGAYIADVTPLEKRAAGFGIVGAAFGIGFILGPAIGGLGAHFGLRVPFWIAAALSGLNGCYGLFVLPESLPIEKRSTTLNWARANPLGALALLRSHRELLGLAGSNLIAYIAHQSFGVYVLYTIYRYSWSAETNGFSLALVGVVSVLVSMVLVKLAVARFGERTTLLLGLACAAAGFVLWAIAPNSVIFFVGIPLISLWGLATPPTQALMSRRVAPHEQGELQGAINSLRGLATLIGPVVFGAVFATFIPHKNSVIAWLPNPPIVLPGAPWYLAALFILCALALAAVVTRDTPSPAK